MLRRLCGSWKQLIYYNFDQDMTKDILFELIRVVEASGFPVVAMVNDLGPTNIRLWNSLEIDAPHLMKLIRKNFLDSGFDLQENGKVSSECVREIINRSIHDCRTTHKLLLKHVGVTSVK